jgi:branched-chain amino acid transport system permease protein
MQATSQNQLAAYYMGIPVKRLNGLVWGLAAGVAAIAGLLLAPITFVHANMGFIGLKAFRRRWSAAFGSLPGAIVGGLVIGWWSRWRASTCPRASRTSRPTSWCW